MLANVKFIQEKKLIGDYFDQISQDTGRYCFGVNDTMRGLEQGAVETLIVWENLAITRFELQSNDPETSNPVVFLRPDQESDKKFFTDASGQEMEIIDKVLLLEWLANNYKSFGWLVGWLVGRGGMKKDHSCLSGSRIY